VDIEKLNKGKSDSEKLPDTALLYDDYITWGIIGENEKNGGKIPCIKAGIIFDTRTSEANPMKGIWTEVLLFMAPEILGNNDYGYIKLAVTQRQYFTIIKDKLSIVYRLGYQGTIAGNVPFYMQPYMISSFAKVTTTDGLGGEKTLRGVLRNRVVGDGIAYGNFEARWKFLRTTLWNQNLYLGLNVFADVGSVVQKIDFNENVIDAETAKLYFSGEDESLHWSVGSGLRIVLNENFVIAADYGIALDKRDGDSGLYIGIGYLF
jgi:outer membrane protein assembly factor BamA